MPLSLLPYSSLKAGSVVGSRCRRRRTARCLMIAASLYFSFTAAAPPPLSGLEGRGAVVSDAELGEMRGKFITPNAVSYFGLTLQTSWQGSDGVTTQATILFNVDFASGSGTPHMLIGWSRECEGCGDPAMDVNAFGPAARDDYVAITTASGEMPIGGLGSVQGVAQSQNINGTDNQVHNNMRIAVVPIGSVAMAVNKAGLTEVTAGSSKSFEDGDLVRFILEPGEIALALSDGNNMVRQGVSSDLNQAGQHVLLASNMNRITNFMGITVGIDELRQLDRVRVDSALSVMKGRGF